MQKRDVCTKVLNGDPQSWGPFSRLGLPYSKRSSRFALCGKQRLLLFGDTSPSTERTSEIRAISGLQCQHAVVELARLKRIAGVGVPLFPIDHELVLVLSVREFDSRRVIAV